MSGCLGKRSRRWRSNVEVNARLVFGLHSDALRARYLRRGKAASKHRCEFSANKRPAYDIRNACFLFLNEDNFEELMATGKGSLFEDCSGIESPPEFKMFD